MLSLLLVLLLDGCASDPGSVRHTAHSGSVSVTVATASPDPGRRGATPGATAATTAPGTPSSRARGTDHAPAHTSTASGADSTAEGARAADSAPLPVGSCVSSGADRYAPVDCTSPSAYARVIARITRDLGEPVLSGSSGTPGTSGDRQSDESARRALQPHGQGTQSTQSAPASASSSAACPADTDFALGLTVVDRQYPQGVDAGIACLRLLRGPHPGDPGGGAGGWLLPGDCLDSAGGSALQAVPCTGGEGRAALFRITVLVPLPADCPPGTRQTIELRNPGQPTEYGCLVSLQTP